MCCEPKSFSNGFGSHSFCILFLFYFYPHFRRDNLVEASRKDLVGANSEQTASLVAALLKKAKGGVLLLSDAASYAEKTDHYGNLALSLVVSGVSLKPHTLA
jgi:hypothetical protein